MLLRHAVPRHSVSPYHPATQAAVRHRKEIIHDVTSQGVTSRTTHHSRRYKSQCQVQNHSSFTTLQVKGSSPEPLIIHDVTSQGITSRTTHHSRRYKSRDYVQNHSSFTTLQVKGLRPEPLIIHDVTSQGATSRTTHHSRRDKSRGYVQNHSSQNNPVFVFGVLLFASACKDPNSDEPF